MPHSLESLDFQLLLEAASDAMLIIDEKDLVVYANQIALQILGYTQDTICGLNIESLMPLRFRDQHQQHKKTYAQNPTKRAMGSGNALIIMRKNGEELKVDIALSPINTNEHHYILLTIYVTDKRCQAEDAFKISEERLQLAKESADLGIFDFDSNLNILHWDEKMRVLWGAKSEKSVTKRRFLTYIHPDDCAARQAALDAAIAPANNGKYHVEYRVINPSDNVERWVSAIGKMHFEDKVATRLIGVARDITEQKLLEKKLQGQHTEIESIAQQMIAAHTASAIAHELNQPLAAISAYSEVALHALNTLKSKIDGSDELKRALEGCVAQAHRAGASLHELLAFLQKGDLITERFDINDVVKEAINIARSSGYSEFYPILELEQTIADVLGCRVQVQKILVNLVRNAVEAMRNSEYQASTLTIKVRTNSATNMAHVTVQDSGPGLNSEVATRIFEPFFTTKPTGIGMGLSISRALTEANGGQLWLEPSHESGAIFHFTLPLAPSDNPSTASPES